jgi:hypothetical protein
MRKYLTIFLSVFVLGLLVRSVFSLEEYKTEDDEAKVYNVTRVVKTVDGLRFMVQEDRPIEKIAGVYRPIDIDSYVAMKSNKIEKKVEDGDARLLMRIEELAKRLAALEKKVDKLLEKDKVPAAK